jgi:hypothetical protein
MEQNKKQREFSMKYCAGLDDYVVVMQTEQSGIQNTLCLSSHLCQTDERKRCGQGGLFQVENESIYIKM